MIEQLNQTAHAIASDLSTRFPDMTADQIRFWARFVTISGAAINCCNERLAQDGNELSQKGLEMVFEKSIELTLEL